MALMTRREMWQAIDELSELILGDTDVDSRMRANVLLLYRQLDSALEGFDPTQHELVGAQIELRYKHDLPQEERDVIERMSKLVVMLRLNWNELYELLGICMIARETGFSSTEAAEIMSNGLELLGKLEGFDARG